MVSESILCYYSIILTHLTDKGKFLLAVLYHEKCHGQVPASGKVFGSTMAKIKFNGKLLASGKARCLNQPWLRSSANSEFRDQ